MLIKSVAENRSGSTRPLPNPRGHGTFRKKTPKSAVVPKRIPNVRRPKSGTSGGCLLADMIDMIGGRWKVLALWRLRDGRKRFTELSA